MDRLIAKGRKILTDPQNNIFTAASVIMFLLILSRVLGLIRNTYLLELFTAEEVSLFFSAFRLPDTIFEVLVFGTFSSAFIPVFTKLIRKDPKDAWAVASDVTNIGVITFGLFALFVAIFASQLYGVIAPGYQGADRETIVAITRVLLFAQVFFVASYVLTGVLESLKRFIIPALAPVFYNVGIIAGTVFLSDSFGLLAPAYGAFLGAIFHFLIQLPVAIRLGYRFKASISINEHVKKIGTLALPRIIETSFLQISKMTELYLASIISTASYAYYYLGNSLQALPVGLFGLSIAKAAFPTLTEQSEDIASFRKTLWKVIYQVVFLTVPFAAIFIVLRIPIVRLVYGRELFDWASTVQTSLVLSAFGAGIIFQCIVAILSRSFYALHDTKTPVTVSIVAIFIITLLDIIFISYFRMPVWGLAASYSIGVMVQTLVLFYLMNQKLQDNLKNRLFPLLKIILAAVISGISMYMLIKLLDRSVWVKNIPLLGALQFPQSIPFESFVLDTRYTVNLLFLTFFVSSVGIFLYLFSCYLLRVQELSFFSSQIRILFAKGVKHIYSNKSATPIEPTPNDSMH